MDEVGDGLRDLGDWTRAVVLWYYLVVKEVGR